MTTGPSFSQVYGEFHQKVNRYLERIVGKNDADDLTQEVFLKIDKGLEGFQGKSSLSTWVYRIATNAALDKIQSRSHREGRETVSLEAVGSESDNLCADDKSLSGEREAIRTEMNACIREFVAKLPIDYRVVIVLSEIRDLRNQQIADVLDISLDAVKIRLHRARARLKADFKAGCNFYHDKDGKLACDRKPRTEAAE